MSDPKTIKQDTRDESLDILNELQELLDDKEEYRLG